MNEDEPIPVSITSTAIYTAISPKRLAGVRVR
jgi:hypothetical protein